MNFLAHLHLSGDDPGWILGGILGDFAKGQVREGRFPEPVRQGIILHRKIDAFTDTHPEWLKSKELLPEEQRKFAGIVVDVVYDHFLAVHWGKYSDVPFHQWITEVYNTLTEQINSLRDQSKDPSERLDEAAEVIDIMIHHDWLRSYLDRDGISGTLTRISYRSPRLAPMRESGFEYLKSYSEFEDHFLSFYPDLLEAVKKMRDHAA